MTDNVIYPDIMTRLDTPPERVIKNLPPPDQWDEIVVVGHLKNGERYFAANITDGGDVLWLLEMAKRDLLNVDDELTDDGGADGGVA